MTQALCAHMNNKKKKKERNIPLIPISYTFVRQGFHIFVFDN
jgi:hypothetical protein